MPDPVTDLVVAQATSGDPRGTVTFEHTGVAVDRFMVGYRLPEETTWRDLEPQPVATYGSGPYEADVPLTVGVETRVVALSSTGTVSGSNPFATGNFSVEGVWLTPWRNGFFVSSERVYIGAGSPRIVHEVDEEEFNIVGRAEAITQGSGVVRLDRGVIEGTLMAGFSLTHHDWLDHLKNLIKNQRDFSQLTLQSPNRFYPNVHLGSWEDSFVVRGAGSFDVTVPFREKKP